MSQNFHVDAGPFVIDVQLEDSGIRLQRGPITKTIPWNKITGATLFRPPDDDLPDARQEQFIVQFAGQQAVQKIHELQGKVGEVFVAYRDERNSLQRTEVPAPLTDPAFLQEFQFRLGSRWLGETQDRNQVGKKLHTDPGFFRTIFVLVALLGMVAAVGAVLLFGFAGPILNFMSIQKMLLDLQDGNYLSLAYRVLTYITLFVIAYFLHRVIRAQLEAFKTRRFSRRTPLS